MKLTFKHGYGGIEFTNETGNKVTLPDRFLAKVNGFMSVVVRTKHIGGSAGHGMGNEVIENITFTTINHDGVLMSMDKLAKEHGFEV